MKKEYKLVDLLKLISAFLVVGIHTEPFINNLWCDRIFSLFTRLPVPFFFAAAGFFFFLPTKGLPSKEKIKKYTLRILMLYLIWSVIYLPFYIKQHIGEFDLSYFIKSLLWTGINSHLWFLIGNIVAILLTVIIAKKLSIKVALITSVVLIIIGTLYSTYNSLSTKYLNIPFVFALINKIGARNGIFYGFFYFSLGAYIATLKNLKSSKIYLILFITSMILLACECFIGTNIIGVKETILWFMTPFAVLFLIMYSVTNEINISDNCAKFIRNTSTLIYTSQFVFIYFLTYLNIPKCGMLMFILTVILTLIFSYIILLLKNKIKFLKYLY